MKTILLIITIAALGFAQEKPQQPDFSAATKFPACSSGQILRVDMTVGHYVCVDAPQGIPVNRPSHAPILLTGMAIGILLTALYAGRKLALLAVLLLAFGLSAQEAASPQSAPIKKVQLSTEDSLKMSLYNERFQAAQKAVTDIFQAREEHIGAVCTKAKIAPTDCQLVPTGKDIWAAQTRTPQPPPVSVAPENGKKKVEAAKAQ